jgi:hypothetical protein
MGRAYRIHGKEFAYKAFCGKYLGRRLEELDVGEGRFWTGFNSVQNRN